MQYFQGLFCNSDNRPGRRQTSKLHLDMTNLRNLLRCYAMGMSIKSISCAFHVSRNTVRKYVRRYQESGMSPDELMSMREDRLQDLFLDSCNRSRKPSSRMEELEALLPDYVKRLNHKGVTVKSLHDEYLREHHLRLPLPPAQPCRRRSRPKPAPQRPRRRHTRRKARRQRAPLRPRRQAATAPRRAYPRATPWRRADVDSLGNIRIRRSRCAVTTRRFLCAVAPVWFGRKGVKVIFFGRKSWWHANKVLSLRRKGLVLHKNSYAEKVTAHSFKPDSCGGRGAGAADDGELCRELRPRYVTHAHRPTARRAQGAARCMISQAGA